MPIWLILIMGTSVRVHEYRACSVYEFMPCLWWRHHMETFLRYRPFVRGIHWSSVNSPPPPPPPPPPHTHTHTQRPMTLSFDIFFDLRRKKRLSKQSRHRWLETASYSLWRYCNVLNISWMQKGGWGNRNTKDHISYFETNIFNHMLIMIYNLKLEPENSLFDTKFYIKHCTRINNMA